MGWSHPDISLEDLMRHIKGFVDILILASGYQSSGLPAAWDVENIKKALRWGLFFEEVFSRLHDSVDYEGSMKELDAALLILTSNSVFPQDLVHMSSRTLSKARDLILGHLLQTHPLKGPHLVALLTATIEMDIDDLTGNDHDSASICLDKFMFQIESLSLIPGKGFIKDYSTSTAMIGSGTPCGGMCRVYNPRSPTRSYIVSKDSFFVGHSCFIVQELLKRQSTMSCISSVETGLDILLKIFTRNHMVGSQDNLLKGQSSDGRSPESEEMFTELFMWNQWRSKCLSYMLDKRTIRLLSGANLIFSAPKVQWVHIIEALRVSMDAHNDNLLEILEISLLGFISSRWNFLIEYFMSHSFNFLSISKQHSDLRRLLQGTPQPFNSEKEYLNSKEKDVLEYVMPLLVAQPLILWRLPPVLAASIPSWSILFRIYLSEIDARFNADSSSIRCCGCSPVEEEHKDCEVAERIRCLYMYHIQDWNILSYIYRTDVGMNLKNYCESWRINVELNNVRGFAVVPGECVDYVGKYMTSSQFRSDVQRAAEEAALFLATMFVPGGRDGKDAWIFDVDDMLLSTVPYYKKRHFGGLERNRSSLERWMGLGRAPAVEHALNLYQEIRGRGLSIFIISSRGEHLRVATVNNLIKVGYHGWTGLILRCPKKAYNGIQEYKVEQRRNLIRQGYRIWGIMGDQWSSLKGCPSAKRTFKIPNPMYYDS